MKFARRLFHIALILLITTSGLRADYLVVSRNATIKSNVNRDGTIIERAVKGDTIILLDNGIRNKGYYHVKGPATGSKGWIYRTLVRRYPGFPPSFKRTEDITDIEWKSEMPDAYYEGMNNLNGDELKSFLHDIIDGHVKFSYTAKSTDVWDILKQTDRDPTDSTKVVLLYTTRTRNANKEYDHGNGWTREHVWAKSHGNFGTSKGPGTDTHHLRPVDASVNSSRNNKDLDVGGTEYKDGSFPTSNFGDEDSWEPRDQVKGDIARIIFYMAVRYEGANGELDLEIAEDVNTYPSPLYGRLSTLLEWLEIDPVDNWERRRNDIIFARFQKNRNPFIDHPEFVERIWLVG